MIKLKIEKVEDDNYYLSNNNNNYKFKIVFYDLDSNPKIGDFIYIHESLIKEQNVLLSFGNLISKYGRDINSVDDPDLLVLQINDNLFYLKRLYG